MRAGMHVGGLTIDLLNPGTGRHCRVLENVTLSLETGQILGVTGPSGGGKSTLALAIAGLLPDSARVRATSWQLGTFQSTHARVMHGEEWSRSVRAGMGSRVFLISQDARSTLFPHRTIEWHLQRANAIAQSGTREVTTWCPIEALAESGFREPRQFLKRLPHELSTGECQRVQWAMACRLPLEWLLADEPFASVDEPLADCLAQQLKRMAIATRGVLLVSHHLNVLRDLANSVLVMQQGQLVPYESVQNDILPRTKTSRSVPFNLEMDGTQPSNSETLVRATGLTKTFAQSGWWGPRPTTTAFQNRQLTIPVGARVGLLGGSGTGKTTMARVLMGLCDATSGEIERFPDVVETPSKTGSAGWKGPLTSSACQRLWRDFQMVHQDTDLVFDPACRLGDALAQVLHVSQPGIPTRDVWEITGEWLRRFGMSPEMLLSPATRLSGGEKRRAAIVRGLLALGAVPQPLKPTVATSSVRRLLVLDEPTVGLDHFWQSVVIRQLLLFQKPYGLTYLVISHDRNFVREFCDQIVEWAS